jgi:hypothetical protein
VKLASTVPQFPSTVNSPVSFAKLEKKWWIGIIQVLLAPIVWQESISLQPHNQMPSVSIVWLASLVALVVRSNVLSAKPVSVKELHVQVPKQFHRKSVELQKLLAMKLPVVFNLATLTLLLPLLFPVNVALTVVNCANSANIVLLVHHSLTKQMHFVPKATTPHSLFHTNPIANRSY